MVVKVSLPRRISSDKRPNCHVLYQFMTMRRSLHLILNHHWYVYIYIYVLYVFMCIHIYILIYMYIYICIYICIYIYIYQCISLFAYMSCHAFVSTQICLYMPVRFLWVCVCVSIRACGITLLGKFSEQAYLQKNMNCTAQDGRTSWTVTWWVGWVGWIENDDSKASASPRNPNRNPTPTKTFSVTNRRSAQVTNGHGLNGHGWHSWH